jgi:hypothetical protein
MTEEPQHEGFVYIFTNKSLPGLVKIGMTFENPKERAKQLSSTSVPHPFEVFGCVKVNKPKKVERKTHKHLKKFRETENREFFKLEPEKALAVLERISGEVEYLHQENLKRELAESIRKKEEELAESIRKKEEERAESIRKKEELEIEMKNEFERRINDAKRFMFNEFKKMTKHEHHSDKIIYYEESGWLCFVWLIVIHLCLYIPLDFNIFEVLLGWDIESFDSIFRSLPLVGLIVQCVILLVPTSIVFFTLSVHHNRKLKLIESEINKNTDDMVKGIHFKEIQYVIQKEVNAKYASRTLKAHTSD